MVGAQAQKKEPVQERKTSEVQKEQSLEEPVTLTQQEAKIFVVTVCLNTVGVVQYEKLEGIILRCGFFKGKTNSDFERIVQFGLEEGYLKERSGVRKEPRQIVGGKRLESNSEWVQLLRIAAGNPNSKEEPTLGQIFPKNLLELSHNVRAFPPQFSDECSRLVVIIQKLKTRDGELPTPSKLADEIKISTKEVKIFLEEMQSHSQAVFEFVEVEGQEEKAIRYTQSPIITLPATAKPLQLIATRYSNFTGKTLLKKICEDREFDKIFKEELRAEKKLGEFGFYLGTKRIFLQSRLEWWYKENLYLVHDGKRGIRLGKRYYQENEKNPYLEWVLMDNSPDTIRIIAQPLRQHKEARQLEEFSEQEHILDMKEKNGVASGSEQLPRIKGKVRQSIVAVREQNLEQPAISDEEFTKELEQITAEYEAKLGNLVAKTRDKDQLNQAWRISKGTNRVIEKRVCTIYGLPEGTTINFSNSDAKKAGTIYPHVQTRFRLPTEKSFKTIKKR